MSLLILQTRRERWLSVLFTLAIALPLAVGFLPTALTLGMAVFGAVSPLAQLLFFPALSLFFYVTGPKPKREVGTTPWPPLLRSAALPILIALGYGALLPDRPFQWETFLWYVVLAPLGEECLFRGWLYGVVSRLWPSRRMTTTFPFPTAVWLTAFAFSLWHAQNYWLVAPGEAVFQMAYTFVTGLWFGYLRWKTGGLALGTILHCLINLAANLL